MIKVEGVNKTFELGDQTVHALRDINLTIERGEYLSVMGPSGSGKSTFMNIVGCLDAPTEGRYRLDAARLDALNVDDVRALGFDEVQDVRIGKMIELTLDSAGRVALDVRRGDDVGDAAQLPGGGVNVDAARSVAAERDQQDVVGGVVGDDDGGVGGHAVASEGDGVGTPDASHARG